MTVLGPNTNALPELLQAKCVLCCGEDVNQFLHLMPSIQMYHESRGYRFWRLPGFTFILSGMGTGCVEPLLWEVTRPRIIQEIVLIGSAGKMPGAKVRKGIPHWIGSAFLAGTGLDGENLTEPLQPRWDSVPKEMPTASSVSTDLFYGFAPRLLTGGYPLGNGRLKELYRKHSSNVDLVEMEVGPFYAFCQLFGQPALRYIAVKGATNELGEDDEQIASTPAVLERCWAAGRTLLGLES